MTPRLPGDARLRREKAQDTGTWIALVVAVMTVLAVLGLISLILPDIFWLLLVAAAFGLFIALHYFTWGQWLIRHNQKFEHDADE